jgi:hypothetical protein
MGNYLSRYWISSSLQPIITDSEENLNSDGQDDSQSSNCSKVEQGSSEFQQTKHELNSNATMGTPKVFFY